MKTLIYYDKEKRKAVFVCRRECDKGKVSIFEKRESGFGRINQEVTKVGEGICPVCNGTGVEILDIPEL